MTGVSVVIPCHDAQAFVGAAIASALRQTRPPAEILVVDDRSTDGSAAIAEGFGAPVRVLRVDHGNAASARADGAEAARGDMLLFLDADDLLGPHAIEALSGAMPEGGLARCDWRRLDSPSDGVWITRPASCDPLAPWQDELSGWLTGWYCPPCGLMWSRAALARAGGWRRGRYCNQDGDVAMRALARGVRVGVAPFGEAFYRRSPGATVSGRRLDPTGVATRLDILDEVREILRTEGRLPRYERDLSAAYEAVRRDALRGGHGEAASRAGARARPGRLPARARLAAGRLARARSRGDVQHGAARIGPAGRFGPKTLVSVVLPTFERPRRTLRAVRSVLGQDHGALELIVVDDASRDDTVARLASVDDARLRIVRQDVNGGVANARNRGMAEASGEVIAFLDSDDEWLPGKLSASLDALSSAGPLAGIVHCGERAAFPDGSVRCRQATASGWLLGDLLLTNVIRGGGSSVAITRRVYETIGGFDPTLPAAEDWDYWIRAARFFAVAAAPDALVTYHEDDDAGRRSRNMRANMAARRMLFRRHRDELRQSGQAQGFLMESARRELTEVGGHPAEGRRLVLAALAEGPANRRLYPWLPYMMLPTGARALLRRIDGRETPRPT